MTLCHLPRGGGIEAVVAAGLANILNIQSIKIPTPAQRDLGIGRGCQKFLEGIQSIVWKSEYPWGQI